MQHAHQQRAIWCADLAEVLQPISVRCDSAWKVTAKLAHCEVSAANQDVLVARALSCRNRQAPAVFQESILKSRIGTWGNWAVYLHSTLTTGAAAWLSARPYFETCDCCCCSVQVAVSCSAFGCELPDVVWGGSFDWLVVLLRLRRLTGVACAGNDASIDRRRDERLEPPCRHRTYRLIACRLPSKRWEWHLRLATRAKRLRALFCFLQKSSSKKPRLNASDVCLFSSLSKRLNAFVMRSNAQV